MGKNVSAKAMLSLAYFHTGEWERWSKLLTGLENEEPRQSFKDFDELFLGYAWFYTSYEKSASRLEAVVKARRTWIFARTMLASVCAHQALTEEDGAQMMKDALDYIRVPMAVDGDNPFTLNQALFVHSSAIELFGDTSGELVEKANSLAERLDQYPSYVVGSIVRSVYYDRQGDIAKAESAWRDIMAHGHGMTVHWAAAGLCRIGKESLVIQHNWEDHEAQIARAYAQALSSQSNERDEARFVFESLKDQAETWFLRRLLIQIPLLLKEPSIASDQSKKWIAEGGAVEVKMTGDGFAKESIEYLANGPAHVVPFNPRSSDDRERFFANFQMALWDYANGDVRGAVTRLEDCPSFGPAFWNWWAAAFQLKFDQTGSK